MKGLIGDQREKDMDSKLLQRLKFSQSKKEDLKEYKFVQRLGEGMNGYVLEVKDASEDDGEHIIIKRVDLKKVLGSYQETDILYTMGGNHPTIPELKWHIVHDETSELFIGMERAKGVELLELVEAQPVLNLEISKHIIRQLADGLAFVHKHNIVHRDIKPENIMVNAKDEYSIKIVDWGMAFEMSGVEICEQQGSPMYVAPEVIDQWREPKIGVYNDVWAIGIVIYILLTGYFPFYGNDQAQLFYRISQFDWRDDSIKDPNVLDLLQKIFIPYQTRITAEKILQHSWLSLDTRNDT